MLLFTVMLLAQAPVQTPTDSARAAWTVSVPRVEAGITVDGVLDEPAWQRAARLGNFSQSEPVDGRAAEERTEVLVWYAPDAIHFGIIAHDREPASIRATRADRDNIDGEDHVIVYLDTFNDRRRAFFFAVNPLGVQQDGIRSEGASSAGQMFGGNNIDKSPDYAFDSRGRVTAEGYTVEVRIPFKSLRYASAAEQTWGLNIVRKVQRTGYTDTWTEVRRASASFLAQSGTITGLRELRRGVVLEAQPFVTAKANGQRALAGAPFERESIDPDAGANLRLGLTSLALDATINPDFSQVESDAAQVTVNERFAIFFPEKRPFFLEGIDLFNTPNQLVYTRRIADPWAGGKITGKLGTIGVAHITALDHGFDDANDALFNVTRLRRDFGSSSIVGVTYTDRTELDANAHNRVLAADARWVFARLYYLEGQIGHAWTRRETPPLPASRSMSGALWKLDFDRTGRSWGFHYGLNGIDDEFTTASGFVPRSGIVSGRGFNRFTLYGARGALLESFQVFGGVSRIWRYDDFLERGGIEGGENANFMTRWRGGWQVNADVQRNFVRVDPAVYANYSAETSSGAQPYSALEQVSGPSASVTITTPTFQLMDATTRLQRSRIAIFAEGSAGTATSITNGVSLRPTTSWRIALTNTFQRIVRERDGSEFARTIIPRIKAEYQPTRAFFFRTIAEYRSERRDGLEDARSGLPLTIGGRAQPASRLRGVRVDLLASYEPTPGTVAFVGYGSSLVANPALTDDELVRMSDGFFLKLAYQFRR